MSPVNPSLLRVPKFENLAVMSIAILNRLPLDYAPYSRWLAPRQKDLVLFNSKEKWIANEEDTKGVAQEYQRIELIENYDLGGMLDRKVIEHHRRCPIERIVSNSEIDVIRAARLREKLRIPGQGVESALAYRDKIVMKSLVQKAGIPVANFHAIDCAMDLIEFVEIHGYPIVVKPRTGAGSVNTSVIPCDDRLNEYLLKGLTPILELSPNLMAETYVNGNMYHVDGLIINSQLILCWPSAYLNGCLAFQQGQPLGSYLLGPDNPLVPRLISFTKRVIAALPTPQNMVFHAEAFRTPDDQLVFCEIACRTGGAKVAEAMELGFGLNIREAWFQAEAGINPRLPDMSPPSVQAGWLLLPPKDAKLVSIPEICNLPGVQRYEHTPHVGKHFHAGETSVENIASFVCTGNSEEEIVNVLESGISWLQREASWE